MPLSTIKDFLQKEASAGILLLIAATLAMAIVNSPLGVFYESLLQLPIGIRAGSIGLEKPLLLWVNDGLMAVFFFLVGLEIKREILEGELSTLPQALLPAIAALGGMVGPAFLYFLLNKNEPANLAGWAIPTATDIAFATGAMALLGSRVPSQLKILLLALAVLDDLGAILIIAIFYTVDLSTLSLGLSAIGFIALILFNRLGITNLAAYVLVGIFIWFFVLKSGVHATLAGSLVALTIPLRPKKTHAPSPLLRCEHALHPWVAFGIMPIFAFANAGLSFSGIDSGDFLNPLTLGIILGLFLGKQIGVLSFIGIASVIGLVRLPAECSWRHIHGMAILTGIGFTMSLFIGSLAFEDVASLEKARLGVVIASALSVLFGILSLATIKRQRRQ